MDNKKILAAVAVGVFAFGYAMGRPPNAPEVKPLKVTLQNNKNEQVDYTVQKQMISNCIVYELHEKKGSDKEVVQYYLSDKPGSCIGRLQLMASQIPVSVPILQFRVPIPGVKQDLWYITRGTSRAGGSFFAQNLDDAVTQISGQPTYSGGSLDTELQELEKAWTIHEKQTSARQ